MDTNVAGTAGIPVIPGTPFNGGFIAGIIQAGELHYALIVAPKGEGEHDEARWSKSLKDLAGARSFFDGAANTAAMAEAGSALAKWAQGLTIGGHRDWYLPARDELELLYRGLKPTEQENWCYRGDNPSSSPVGYAYSPGAPAQTVAEAFKAGGAEAFELEYYWSSTQYAGGSDYAWIQDFYDGYQDDSHKDNAYRARAVRRVPIR